MGALMRRLWFPVLLAAMTAWGGLSAFLLLTPASAPSYSGILDVTSTGILQCVGIAACSAAGAAANAKIATTTRTSDSVKCDIDAATTGGPGLTAGCSDGGASNGLTTSAFCNATTCNTYLWDRSGTNSCYLTPNPVPCDTYSTTQSQRPTIDLTTSPIGLSFASASTQTLVSYNVAGSSLINLQSNQSQPVTVVAVIDYVSGAGQKDFFSSTGAFQFGVQCSGTGNTFIYAGSACKAATAAAGSLHVMVALFNDTSSEIWVDDTGTAANSPGTGGLTNTAVLAIGQVSSADWWNGHIDMVAVYAGDVATANHTSFCHTLRVYWGSAGTC